MFSLIITVALISSRVLASYGDSTKYPHNYVQWELDDGITMREDITGPPEDINVTPDQIKIYYYSKSDPHRGILIDTNDPVASLRTTDFKKSKPTILVTHGWRSTKDSPSCILIRDTSVQKGGNTFVVDWSRFSLRNYVTARLAVPDVGHIIGNFLKAISVGSGLDWDTTKLVGHSLGAHVCGFAGKTLNSKVDTIIGLNPAYPLFDFNPAGRLAATDARFVEVIHTCAPLAVIPYQIGHADFYPNGGDSQPGCLLTGCDSCADARSYVYYEESLRTGNFVAKKCDSYKHYKSGSCDGNLKANMGEYVTDKRAEGKMYLDTNAASPFAKGG